MTTRPSYGAGLAPDARPLDRGKPRDEDTEGGNQPADKSLINRRLSLRSQLCAAMASFADGGLAERALNRVFPLDREHKRLKRVRLLKGLGQILVIFASLSAQLLDRRQLILGEIELALDDVGFAEIFAHLRIGGI